MSMVSFDVLVCVCEVAGWRSYIGLARANLAKGWDVWVEACRVLYLDGISLTAAVIVSDNRLGRDTGLRWPCWTWASARRRQRLARCGIPHTHCPTPLGNPGGSQGGRNSISGHRFLRLGLHPWSCAYLHTTNAPHREEGVAARQWALVPPHNYVYLGQNYIPRYDDEFHQRRLLLMRYATDLATFASTSPCASSASGFSVQVCCSATVL